MSKILAFNGSPRRAGNTALLLDQFMQGNAAQGSITELLYTDEVDIINCRGCLRCNILKRCSIQNDDWPGIRDKILEAQVLVFASPIYFHHVTASMKQVIDRFRSFVHVQITETGIKHTAWEKWDKDFVVILPMGSSDDVDAQPVIDLFNYICSILGPRNRLHVIKGTRLAMAKQVGKTADELKQLYPKLNLPVRLVEQDYQRNQELLKQCFELGQELCKKNHEIKVS